MKFDASIATSKYGLGKKNGSPLFPIIDLRFPFLSRTINTLLPASANTTNDLFADTEVIIALSSNGPHSPISFPSGLSNRIVSVVAVKIVSPEVDIAVTGLSVLLFHNILNSGSVSYTHLTLP